VADDAGERQEESRLVQGCEERAQPLIHDPHPPP
jgi:hypothetical protein